MVLCVVYFGGGVIQNGIIRGRRGTNVLPHAAVWRELASLVRDGIVFVGERPRRVSASSSSEGSGAEVSITQVDLLSKIIVRNQLIEV